jgi:hypothetical protein
MSVLASKKVVDKTAAIWGIRSITQAMPPAITQQDSKANFEAKATAEIPD